MTATFHIDTGALHTILHTSLNYHRSTTTDVKRRQPIRHCDRLPKIDCDHTITALGLFWVTQLEDLHRSTAQAIMKLLKEQMQTETETFERFHEKVGNFEIAFRPFDGTATALIFNLKTHFCSRPMVEELGCAGQ